jgi:hypothetical protein
MTLAERSRMLFLVVAAAMLPACTGELVELTPTAKRDLSTASADLGPAPDGDGTDGMPAPRFDPDLQNDINRLGCGSSSCHGGSTAPILKANPVSAADKTANYDNFKARAMAGEISLVLTKNLEASGVSHAGGKSFPSTSDATYRRWLAWINAGNPP